MLARRTRPLLLVGALLLLCSCALSQQAETEANLSNQKLSGLIQWKYEKRPFCNAFTGCGRKRDVPVPPYPLLKRAEFEERTGGGFAGDDSADRGYGAFAHNHLNNNNDEPAEGLGDLIDINAEPAVENVQKQIMSQAKIFEAIREASKEIFRQKTKQKLRRQQQEREREREHEEEEAEAEQLQQQQHRNKLLVQAVTQ